MRWRRFMSMVNGPRAPAGRGTPCCARYRANAARLGEDGQERRRLLGVGLMSGAAARTSWSGGAFAPSPDDASHRSENHVARLGPFILRDAAQAPLLRMRSCAAVGF